MNGDIPLSPARWMGECLRAWDRFWFTPMLPHTLAFIRVCCGLMVAYVHVVWASQLEDFFGSNSWIRPATIREMHGQDWGWSWLFSVDSLALLWIHQIIAVVSAMLMALGLFTRIAIPLAWWMTLMVCHRETGSLFGLDQVIVMLMMYLMWSRSGAVWSLDALLRKRFGVGWLFPDANAAIANTLSTRLIQLHLCVIYIFGGLSKMRGEMWFDGSALWWTAVNFEYQSLDITWLGHYPLLISALTGATIFWETFYCALVWPKLTRPIALAMAVLVHGGIAVALGMVTFGVIMIVANMSFIYPETTRHWIRKVVGAEG